MIQRSLIHFSETQELGTTLPDIGMVLMRLAVCVQYMHNGAMKLTYDPDKNRANIRKHGISLAETEAVFTIHLLL